MELDKGGVAEEALRLYFRELGAYVLRGVKVRAGKDEVTDIDLWVYTRASVHARHVAIVDIKNKKRTKPYERLIWLKGLQAAVGADEAIVANNAARDEIGPFAERIGVKVLSPQVFKNVLNKYSDFGQRYSSEEMDDMWRQVKFENGTTLASLVSSQLTEVSLGLGFVALNIWIDDASKMLEYCYDHERILGPVARAVMFFASLVAVAADYVGRKVAFADLDTRRAYFREGLLFGDMMEGISRRYVGFAERVVTDYLDKSGAAAATIRAGFQRSLENLPIGAFIDFFSRPGSGRELIDAAAQLENAAFSRQPPNFANLPSEAKTVVGLIIDYRRLDRRRLFKQASELTAQPSSGESEAASAPGEHQASSGVELKQRVTSTTPGASDHTPNASDREDKGQE